MATDNSFLSSLKVDLYRLYNGQSTNSIRFAYGMLSFDLITILFFVFTSMAKPYPWIIAVDVVIGIVIALDYLARLWMSRRKLRYVTSITAVADVIVIISLLAPAFVEHFTFLRVLRALRLLRSYHVLQDLRQRSHFFAENEEIIQSILNLTVFVFIITAVVYVMQVRVNDNINTYMDALYFTITTLTTTGFGDITLIGESGRFLAIVIMVVGISLFLRLVQTIFRPTKVKYTCPECGLNRHDKDAVHCKHCGLGISISTEGL